MDCQPAAMDLYGPLKTSTQDSADPAAMDPLGGRTGNLWKDYPPGASAAHDRIMQIAAGRGPRGETQDARNASDPSPVI